MSRARPSTFPGPLAWPEHGGPDPGPPIAHDFSTNANPWALPAALRQALAEADRQRYPDPRYQALRARLAPSLGVSEHRLLPTAGSSEAIRRLTLAASQHGRRVVWLPEPGYGDYRAAAQALGLRCRPWREGSELLAGLRQGGAALVWLNEPHNPSGGSLPTEFWLSLAELAGQQGHWLGLDRAYEPLRLIGADPVPAAVADRCWQCLSPNKALGLTGVRAGLLVAPRSAAPTQVQQVEALAASWVVSAEGVALLQAWMTDEVQVALGHARQQLRDWQAAQRRRLSALGWQQRDSVTPFWLARPPGPAADLARSLAHLRRCGIKLRDARSFGLPGWVRLATLPPASQQALCQAWADWRPRCGHAVADPDPSAPPCPEPSSLP